MGHQLGLLVLVLIIFALIVFGGGFVYWTVLGAYDAARTRREARDRERFRRWLEADRGYVRDILRGEDA